MGRVLHYGRPMEAYQIAGTLFATWPLAVAALAIIGI